MTEETKQGELFSEDKKKKPQSKRAKSAQRKRNQLKGEKAQRRAEEQRGGEQLKPEQIWPNYPHMSTSQTLLRNTLSIGGAAVGGMLRGLLRISNPYGI